MLNKIKRIKNDDYSLIIALENFNENIQICTKQQNFGRYL